MTVRLAIIQKSPVYNDLTTSIDMALQLIDHASGNGASLIVFGECWLSGYPAWLDISTDTGLWDHEPVKLVYAQMFENSPRIPEDLVPIQRIAKEKGVTLVIGMNERVEKGRGNNSIYNAAVIINQEGEIANHHRKLMPTYTEKLVHGLGDGQGLKSVDTPIGRIGTLICWEHFMPLTRQAMHDEGEDIHIALWPHVKEMHQVACRQYAMEGRCYVVAAGQTLRPKQLPQPLNYIPDLASVEYVMNGQSCVFGPDGSYLRKPASPGEDIVFFDLPPLSGLHKEKMTLATSGHYQRWDIFDFQVNKNRT